MRRDPELNRLREEMQWLVEQEEKELLRTQIADKKKKLGKPERNQTERFLDSLGVPVKDLKHERW